MKKMFRNLIISNKNNLDLSRSDEKEGAMIARPGRDLLSEKHRQLLIKQIWDLTAFTHDSFRLHVEEPLVRFAELVQLLPASSNHHHSYIGGLLDHGLEVVIYALKIRRNMLLPPVSKPEEQRFVDCRGDIWCFIS